MNNEKWEIYSDSAYFDMWAVREIDNKNFDNPRLFHFALKEDAENFKKLVEKSH